MSTARARPWFSSPAALLLAVLTLTACVYWPGLSGGYLFDDFPNIVENDAVHVTTLEARDWQQAALASPSADLRRPLAMLSYAANYYFTGSDPRPMKLCNLAIHLLNGLLLWAVLGKVLRLWNERRAQPLPQSTLHNAALGLTAAWLLCPINISSVLYVVQRMESLAQVFVLAGLLVYLHGRERMLRGQTGVLRCAAGLALGAVLGLGCKESSVLLPVYAFLLELTLLRFAGAEPGAGRKLWTIYVLLLFLPTAAGLAWLLPRTLPAAAYASRPFTLEQRLLTETRILLDYVRWTLLPLPQQLGFYHDDIALSRGWLSPPATLASALLIGASWMAAAICRRRLPLLALGIGWYFAAHLLTATVIPLELVFEHRNYFASVGLLLAAGALILEIPPGLPLLRWSIPLLGLTLFATGTVARSIAWGNPVRFAYGEALEHPASPRANYELGRTLAITSGYRPDSKLITPALQAFERASRLSGGDASSLAGMIIVASHMHQPVPAEWWQELSRRLAAQPPSAEDISGLLSLSECQRKGDCDANPQPLLSAFLAALGHPHPSARLLGIYGGFAANQLGDYTLAERSFAEAATMSPRSAGFRLDLARVLLLEGKQAQALQALDALDPRSLSRDEEQQVKRIRSGAGPH
ncbi:MAG: hypothetical protein P4L83_10865 [Nevskia sp.]|nr:hypothetical protein [Nevskia sp.]